MIGIVTLNPCIDKSFHIPADADSGFVNVSSVRYITGGKGINVSRALRQFCVRHRGIAPIGGDNGRRIEELLRAEGAPCSLINVSTETRTITTAFRPDGSFIAYKEAAAPWTAEDVSHVEHKMNVFLEGLTVLVLSGSVPPGCPADIYARVIARAKAKGITVILDSSGKELVEGLRARPDYAVPNDEEINAFLGYEVKTWDDRVQAVEAMMRAGIAHPIVTLGKNGALFGRPGRNKCCEVVHAHGRVVETVNPTGCGDSFLAGLLYGLSQDLPLEKCVSFGLAAGASDALSSDAGVISLFEVLKYEEDIVFDVQP